MCNAITKLEVNSKAMEFFGALPNTPKEECLRIVRASDVFVGIIGMRYGYTDPATGKSMTQLEYEEAQTVRLPTLMYLIDEESHPVLPKHVEMGAGAEKLIAFKATLKNAHVVNTFSSPDDLVAKVTQEVVRLLGAMATKPLAQVLPQLAANATRVHHLTQPRFEFLKGKVIGVYKQHVPDAVLREALGFVLAGDNMAATFVLTRGTPMGMDEAVDGLMAIEKIFTELFKKDPSN
ncbi:hypothetical protein BSY239_3475 [Hydrogenophaga sp. RAC07]|nr:hypothetical protein BSY239_3475 [Hydrogenophaga sp. RAC07]